MNGIHSSLTGMIVASAEVRRTRDGKPWARFGVAVDTENDAEAAASFVRVSLFGPTVPDLAPQLVAAARVYCKGKMTLRGWRNSDGETRAGLNLVAQEVKIMAVRECFTIGPAPVRCRGEGVIPSVWIGHQKTGTVPAQVTITGSIVYAIGWSERVAHRTRSKP